MSAKQKWTADHIPAEAADEYQKITDGPQTAEEMIAKALNVMHIPRIIDVIGLANAICDWREAWEVDPKDKRSFDIVLIEKLTKAFR